MDFIKEKEDFSYKSICFTFKGDFVIISNSTNTSRMTFAYKEHALEKIITLLANKNISNWVARQITFNSDPHSLTELYVNMLNITILKGLA